MLYSFHGKSKILDVLRALFMDKLLSGFGQLLSLILMDKLLSGFGQLLSLILNK